MVEFLPSEKLGDDVKVMVEQLRQRIWEHELDELKPEWVKMYSALRDEDRAIRSQGIIQILFLIDASVSNSVIVAWKKAKDKAADKNKSQLNKSHNG